MKIVVLSLLLCFMASAIYSQTIDVIHLKNGLDARGTVIGRTENQITVQTENGRTLSFDMTDIESMEQEQKAFDPRVLIGRWACYKASGERDERYDMAISENMGFYTVNYIYMIHFNSNSGTIKSFPRDTPITKAPIDVDLKDIDIEKGIVSYRFHQKESCLFNEHLRREGTFFQEWRCDITLNYTDGILRGKIDCINHYCQVSYHNIDNEEVLDDAPCGKWNVYFVKY